MKTTTTVNNQSRFFRLICSASAPLLLVLFIAPSLVRAQTLAEALDTTSLTWTTGGTAPWFGQRTTTHDGLDAAESGTISNDQYSWIQTTVIGPGSVTFWWKVSSESGYDWLAFVVGGLLQTNPNSGPISGEVGWQERTYEVPSGSQNLMWIYTKDAAGADGQDKAWVDEVRYTTNIAPRIAAQPRNTTASEGSSVTLQVTAIGSLPFSYQWALNDVPLAGATNSVLTFTSAQPYNSGRYAVKITNPNGSIMSTSALMHVTSPVPISLQGTNRYSNVSDLFVTNGYAFLTQQGRSTLALWVLDVRNPSLPTYVGEYTPPVWDPIGRDYSTSVQVAGRYAYVMVAGYGDGSYHSLVLDVSSPSNIVQVAQLPGYCMDVELAGDFAYMAIASSHDPRAGFVVCNVANPAAPFEVGRVALSTLDATSLCVRGTNAYVINNGNELLRIYDVSNPAAPVETGSYWLPQPGGYYTTFGHAISVQDRYAYVAAGFYGLLILDVANPATPVEIGRYIQYQQTSCLCLVGRYAFIADQDRWNGSRNYEGEGLTVVDVSDPANPVRVGGYSDTSVPSSVRVVDNRIYLGDGGLLIFEFARPAVAIPPESRIATAGETVTLNVSALGTPPLRYQWQAYGTNISGATNATLSLTNVQANQTGHYWVRVSNTNGSVFSPSATLLVVVPPPLPPVVTIVPQSTTAGVGTDATFNSVVGGMPPFNYQWFFNGTNQLGGATNASLVLTNVQLTNAGQYSIVVSSAEGSATNAATLVVVTVWFGSWSFTNGEFRVSLHGVQGKRYELQASTNLVYWTALTTLSNSTGTIRFTNTAGGFPRRFYRAKEQ